MRPDQARPRTATKTRSASCPRSASPSPAATSRWQAIAAALDDLAGATRPRHSDPRGCRQRRFHRAVHSARPSCGISACRASSRSTLGPQIWAGAARRRLGRSGATQTDLPGRTDLPRDYLGGNMPTFALNFAGPAEKSSRSTTTSSGSAARAIGESSRPASTPRSFWPPKWPRSARSSALRRPRRSAGCGATQLQRPDPRRLLTLRSFRSRPHARMATRVLSRCHPTAQGTVVQRILVRHGVSRDLASLLLEDIRRGLDFLKTHPILDTGEHRPSYHH